VTHQWNLSPKAPILDAEFVAKLNADPASTWTAAMNPRFAGVSREEAHALAGTFLRAPTPQSKTVRDGPLTGPSTFDARQQWASCMLPIQNQGQCGDCWAFGTSECASWRYCIVNGRNVLLSAQDLTSCDTDDYACGGGYINDALEYITSPGIHSAACEPFASASGNSPACPNSCVDGESWSSNVYTGQAGSVQQLIGVNNIANTISSTGPVSAGFEVYDDFFSYNGGVYIHTSGGLAGGHAILILGYGTYQGTPYWLCANSWGTSWGIENGYFMILSGSDECGIEDSVYTISM